MIKNWVKKITTKKETLSQKFNDILNKFDGEDQKVAKFSDKDITPSKLLTKYTLEDIYPFKIYICKKDDTMEGICESFQIDFHEITKINKILSKDI